MLTTIPPVHNEPRAAADISLPLDGALAGRCARPRTLVYICLKNAQIVRHNPAPVTPYKLPNWIHMSFRRSEIRSDQCISDGPKTWSDYPLRSSDDDFRRYSPVGFILHCSDELIHRDPDAAQIHAAA